MLGSTGGGLLAGTAICFATLLFLAELPLPERNTASRSTSIAFRLNSGQ